RVAYGEADAAVTLARSEPLRGTDPGAAAGVLAGLRRVVYAVHTMRIEHRAVEGVVALPALAPLGSAYDAKLGTIAATLRGERQPADDQPLRELLDEALGGLPAGARQTFEAPLDELVDAINTAAGEAVALAATGGHRRPWRAG